MANGEGESVKVTGVLLIPSRLARDTGSSFFSPRRKTGNPYTLVLAIVPALIQQPHRSAGDIPHEGLRPL